MPSPLRCYVLRAEDGGLFCGAHPYDTREEADAAREMAGITDDHAGPFEVVELVEVVRCRDCARMWQSFAGGHYCRRGDQLVITGHGLDWFCAYGEK